MFLNRFRYIKNGIVAREIKFHNGLNLILNSEDAEGGNSIGKSTLGRIIDFLFLAKLDSVYMDNEFKRPNPAVFNLFKLHDIQFELEFKSKNGSIISFRRNAAIEDEPLLFWISGKEATLNQYSESLSSRIFGNRSDKPTIRNLAPKFIRNSHEKMQNTLFFHDPRTRKDVYNHLFPFLFGFTRMDLISTQGELEKGLKNFEKRLSVFRKPHNESVLTRMLKPIDKELSELQNKLSNLNVIGEAGKEIGRLSEIQQQLSEISINISKLNFQLVAHNRTKNELESHETNINESDVRDLYEFASKNVDAIQKSYAEALSFHKLLIERKISFINESSDQINSKIEQLTAMLNALEKKESEILTRVKRPEVMDIVINLQNEISQASKRRGEIEGILKSIEDIKASINSSNTILSEVKNDLKKQQAHLNDNINGFNDFLGEYSKYLYGERYVFSLDFNIESGDCEFSIDSASPSPEGGKKKGEISAFDLAYISFVESVQLNRPMFVLHDSIEDIDPIQIEKIFDIALKSHGQYIVSVLRDKLSTINQDIVSSKTILELSPASKFFMV